MPYCPKCDMEFIDGITICSDCGGPLAESEEAAKIAFKKQQEEEQLAQTLEKEQLETQKLLSNDLTDQSDTPDSPIAPSKIYIKKEQKYDDLKASASAFIIVGGILLVFSLLCWLGIVNIPMVGVGKLIFQSALTLMGIFSLFTSISSHQAAKKLAPQIADENKATEGFIQWFIASHNGETIDQTIPDSEELSPEELSLKRFQLIQDYLITNHDLPDPAYVDALCEDIYSKLYD